MDNSRIPPGYTQVMPYIIVPDAAGFIQFLQKVFGAQEKLKMMRDVNAIMHAEMAIGDCTLMLADSTEQWGPNTSGLFIYVDNADDTFNKALDAGATTVMELSDQKYGRTCGVKDAWGNTWWITSVMD